MKSKKSLTLSQAFPAVLILILVAVLVIVSILIFANLQTSFPSTTISVVNESGYINATGDSLNTLSACGFANPSIINIINNTDSVIIAAANYTLNTTTYIITNATSKTFPNVSINYNYGTKGAACTASTNMISQFATYPALVGLVGTIIFLALVIGVLVASFAFGRKGGV